MFFFGVVCNLRKIPESCHGVGAPIAKPSCKRHPTSSSAALVLLLLAIVSNSRHQASACTAILVGRKATIDGSILATHSDDGEGNNDPRIMYVPSVFYDDKPTERDIFVDVEDFPRYVGYNRGPDYYPERSEDTAHRPVHRPIGSIPQVVNRTTYSYFDANEGIMNSKQLIVGGESTCSGIFTTNAKGQGGKALLSVNALARIALERATTAREAIQLMGTLSEKYGFYGADSGFEGSAESLMVADKHEGFVFHILPDDTGTSSVWVAKRVPDDEVTVVANMFTIREVDLTDTYNYIGSEYMYTVAKRNGLWKEGEELDFTKTFSNGEYGHKYYSGRRMWGAYRLLAPHLKLDAEYDNLKEEAAYPWSVKPDRLLTLEDVFRVHRDYYQGTKYDTSKGIAAGPFGNPDRFVVTPEQNVEIENRYQNGYGGSFERPIAIYRTTYTIVMQTRSWLDDSIGGVMWVGSYAPHGTCFLPFSVGVDSLPDSLTTGRMSTKMDRNSAFWTFRYMHTLARLRYNKLSGIIHKKQKYWENVALQLQTQIEQDTRIVGNNQALTELYHNHTSNVLNAWWDLADELVFLAADGFDNVEYDALPLGYSPEWLEAVGYQNGPPPADYDYSSSSSHNSYHISSDNNYDDDDGLTKEVVFMTSLLVLVALVALQVVMREQAFLCKMVGLVSAQQPETPKIYQATGISTTFRCGKKVFDEKNYGSCCGGESTLEKTTDP